MKHQAEELGARRESWNQTDGQEKRKQFHFTWDIDTHNLIYMFISPASRRKWGDVEYKKINSTQHIFSQFQTILTLFTPYTNINKNKTQPTTQHKNSYYNSTNLHYHFSIYHKKNNEEYAARRVVIEEAKKKAAETRKKNEAAKIVNEKKLLKELMEKYGVSE